MSQFQHEGVNFYYRVDGEDNQETILFLNGIMASVNSWDFYVKPLVNKGFKVVRVDFRGQLRSDKPAGPYTFKMHAEDTLALINHLNINHTHIIGTSYGGEIALKFAAMYPSTVNKLMIINSTAKIDEGLERVIHTWKMFASSCNAETFMQGMLPFLYSDEYLLKERQTIDKMIASMKNLSEDYYIGQQILYDTFLNECDLESELSMITHDTLLVGSSLDVLKPMRMTLFMHEKLKHSHVIELPDAAHVSIFEKPDLLLKLMIGQFS